MSGRRAFETANQTFRPRTAIRASVAQQGANMTMVSDPAIVTRDHEVPSTGSEERVCIYWHRELPPIDAEMMGEHVLEATSSRVCGSLAFRDELWDRSYHHLMQHTHARLKQEIDRLGGHYAHVLYESIDSRHDDATGEAWLHGRFTYILYRQPR
jgi:hypothetical protein